MIGKLKGVVEEVAEDHLLIDVGGVGYVVFASRRTLGQLPAAGTAVALLIDTHVREDHIHLYGFLERAERDWFRLLLTVQGVGARNSLSILSVAAPQEIAQAVLAKDRAVLTQAPGVGPKLAQRILLELKDKAGRFAISTGAPAAVASDGAGVVGGLADDAVEALVALGYRRGEAFAAIGKVAAELGADCGVEVLIKSGLKELAR
ncbi:MAG TPA: Holliday junction branch migration protein RuvA [Kiloniellales bacterium]|nr:Holliday junction branch migration protein RuvA [Kiloniellales bacterium]